MRARDKPLVVMMSDSSNIWRGCALLALSAFLFASMGVLIRIASHTLSNEMIVFSRNLMGVLLLGPILMKQGVRALATRKFPMHLWRALVGLTAMYGFFYAIAHIPLSSAMVFTYSSPVFIPLVARWFLKESMTWPMWVAALLGLLGVILVCKPEQQLFSAITAVGIFSSLMAAMAFVTVRGLTVTEPVTRIVFYFASISTIVSAVPLCWAGRIPAGRETALLAAIGTLATLSQLALSRAYSFAPAGRIGPLNYLAIVIAGIYAWLLWGEKPDALGILGTGVIFIATLLCLPTPRRALTNPDNDAT